MRVRNKLVGAIVLVGASALASGCGGEGPDPAAFRSACAEVPGCAEPRSEPAGPQETIYRVQVVREASGDVRIARVEAVAVTEGEGVPLGRLAGSHMLVGLDGAGEPVDGQVIGFPEVLRAEPVDGWAGPLETDLTGAEVDVVGYVRALPEVEELAVMDESGAVAATSRAPREEVSEVAEGEASVTTAGALPSALVSLQADDDGEPPPDPDELPSQCSHVMLLEGEADRDVASWVADRGVELVEPGPTQRAVIHGALGLMRPLLCHGVSRIAIGNAPDMEGVGGKVKQLSAGDLMFINVAVGYGEEELAGSAEHRLSMMHTVIHESAHATEALLNAEGSRPRRFAGEWEPESRELASETIERVRLERSLFEEWQLVHRSFVAQGWARPYPGDGNAEARQRVRAMSASQTAESGFMSRYGGTSYAEDIADAVAWTYMREHYRDAGIPEGRRQTEDYACQQMREYEGDGVPSRFAAVFTKLLFLKDLGLVLPEDVASCTGPVGLSNDEPGFHFWVDGELRRSFGMGVTASIGTDPRGRYVFEMEAEGEAEFGDETYPARVRLLLDLDQESSVPVEEVPWPRGVYELGLLAGYDFGILGRAGIDELQGDNGFFLRLDGARAGNFDAYDGFALVAEASNERIAGSVFIRKAFRLQAPVPVPQTFDPPLIVHFAIEN